MLLSALVMLLQGKISDTGLKFEGISGCHVQLYSSYTAHPNTAPVLEGWVATIPPPLIAPHGRGGPPTLREEVGRPDHKGELDLFKSHFIYISYSKESAFQIGIIRQIDIVIDKEIDTI